MENKNIEETNVDNVTETTSTKNESTQENSVVESVEVCENDKEKIVENTPVNTDGSSVNNEEHTEDVVTQSSEINSEAVDNSHAEKVAQPKQSAKTFVVFKDNVEQAVSGYLPFVKKALKNPSFDGGVDNKNTLITFIGWAVTMGFSLSVGLTNIANFFATSFYNSYSRYNYNRVPQLAFSDSARIFVRLVILHMLMFAIFVAVDFAFSKSVLKSEDSYLTILSRYTKHLVPMSFLSLLSVVFSTIHLTFLSVLSMVFGYLILSFGNSIVLTDVTRFKNTQFSRLYYAIIVVIITAILNGIVFALFSF